MDKKAERRKRRALTIGFVVFLGIVVVTLLWVLGLLWLPFPEQAKTPFPAARFGAEYGLTMGSQTTIVSKGGTNQWHGDVFEYLRKSCLDARGYFDALDTTNHNGFGTDKSLPFPGKRIPPYQRNNFGGSGGGPIIKDKTFFYTMYEGLRQNLGLSP